MARKSSSQAGQDQLTPVMEQYQKIQRQHPGVVILFRLGDFYEIFGEPAIDCARIMQVQLTSRNRGKPHEVPMCGIPHHSAETYVARLIKAGKKVAFCDQIGKAPAKGLMQREVVQIITPGTVFQDSMLQGAKLNYIASFSFDTHTSSVGLAFCDITTGKLLFEQVAWPSMEQRFFYCYHLYAPSEVLLPKSEHLKIKDWLKTIFKQTAASNKPLAQACIEWRNPQHYNSAACRAAINDHYQPASLQKWELDQQDSALIAIGVLLNYLKETQFIALNHLEDPQRISDAQRMRLDAVSINNLELFSDSAKQPSLYGVLNKTTTPMGARSLQDVMLRPFVDIKAIQHKLAAVAELIKEHNLKTTLQQQLKMIGDLERLAGRVNLPNMNIRYLFSLRSNLGPLPLIKQVLAKFKAEALSTRAKKFDDLVDIHDYLAAMLSDDPHPDIKNGNLIKSGVDQELDQKRALVLAKKTQIASLEAREKQQTGVSNLKIGYNRVFGFYIEVSNANKLDLPDRYIPKQTLANCQRFTTNELQVLEQALLLAQAEVETIETNIYQLVSAKIKQASARIRQTARLIGELDLFLSFAKVAQDNNYCRPELLADSHPKIFLKQARHPVLEFIRPEEQFIPNDLKLDQQEHQSLVITGPNMGGKSTFMRQSALACYMAQLGCYVAAEEARLTVFDRIFTRVGASDNLAKGQSTFMVEMSEVALIVRQATAKSLVILDELGRGTSTFDGIGLAWSIIDHLCSKGVLSLCATHYRELTQLATHNQKIKNYHVAVRQLPDDLLFTHKIVSGSSDKSYGIQVAKLAGLPQSVLRKAKEIYDKFEQREIGFLDEKEKTYQKPETILAREAEINGQTKSFQQHLAKVASLDLDHMTPVEGFQFLCELQHKIK